MFASTTPRIHSHQGSLSPVSTLRTIGIGLALLTLLCEVAAAQESVIKPASYADPGVLAGRVETNGSSVTHEVESVRTRMLSAPPALVSADGRPSADLAGVNYRVWMSKGRADVGVGVGTVGYMVPLAARDSGGSTLVGSVPMVTVGVRYHMSKEHSLFADASGAKGLGADPNSGYYNTKVGVEWKPAKSRLGLDGGALGFHFDSGYRVTVRPKHGGLGVYLRTQF